MAGVDKLEGMTWELVDAKLQFLLDGEEEITVPADATEAESVINSCFLAVCDKTNFGRLFAMDRAGVGGDKDDGLW